MNKAERIQNLLSKLIVIKAKEENPKDAFEGIETSLWKAYSDPDQITNDQLRFFEKFIDSLYSFVRHNTQYKCYCS